MTDELKQRPEDQPLPNPGRDDVQKHLIEAIQARREIGIQRYGSPLMTHNGRDALQDAWEEALDLAAYLTQVRMEADDTAKAIDRKDRLLKRLEEQRDEQSARRVVAERQVAEAQEQIRRLTKERDEARRALQDPETFERLVRISQARNGIRIVGRALDDSPDADRGAL